MPGRNAQNMPMWAFEGDYHPVKVMDGDKTLFRAKEETQTGTDMAFERAYNDRVDVVAQGRSKQEAVIANPQILQFPASYIRASIAGRLEIVSIQGHKITLRSLTTDPSHRYLYVIVPMTLKAEAYSFKYLFQVVSGSPVASAGSIRIMNSALAVEYAYITSKSDFLFTPPAAGNYSLVLYLSSGNNVSSEVVASFDLVAISVSEASVNSPSPDYPSPIISSAGSVRAQDQAGARHEDVAIPELRGIPDGAGGWAARDTLETVQGHLIHTCRVDPTIDEHTTASIVGAAQYILAAPIITDLGPIDLPSYYPYTRVLVEGEYVPEVTATCKIMEV